MAFKKTNKQKDSALIKQIANHLEEFAFFFSFPSNLLTFKLCLCSVVLIIKSLRTLMWPFETFCSALEQRQVVFNQQNQIPQDY